MEQEIVYEKLPADIADRFVLLMDPILGSGGSATRAINVLLSKGVDEGKILFLRWAAGAAAAAAGRRGVQRVYSTPARQVVDRARACLAAPSPGVICPSCSLIAAPEGIHTLCRKFPRMKVSPLVASRLPAEARGQLLQGAALWLA